MESSGTEKGSVDGDSAGKPSVCPQTETASPSKALVGEVVRAILDGRSGLNIVYQPVVNLKNGVVVAYEALSRFPGLEGVSPEVVFASADDIGLGPELELLAIQYARDGFEGFHSGAVLSVNISPSALAHPRSQETLSGQLEGLIIEVTEHADFEDLPGLCRRLDALKCAGAVVAVDDAGSGYSGMRTLIEVRPQIIKLDRSLVEDVDKEPFKYYLTAMLVDLGAKIGSTLLAEGVETDGELATSIALGIPLGQGWLLGRPGAERVELPSELIERVVRLSVESSASSEVHQLLEGVPCVSSDGAPTCDGWANIAVDSKGAPVGLWLREGDRKGGDPWIRRNSLLLVDMHASTRNVLLKAMSREQESRFDPAVFVDETGKVMGLVRIERLVTSLSLVGSPR